MASRAFDYARDRFAGTWLPDSTIQWLTFGADSSERLLAAVTAYGPNRSVLVLFDCDGRQLAVTDAFGGIDSLQTVDATGEGHPDLILFYRSGVGTGWLQHAASVVLVGPNDLTTALNVVTDEDMDGVATKGATVDSVAIKVLGGGRLARIGLRFQVLCSQDGDCHRAQGAPLREIYQWRPASRDFTLVAQ